MKSSTPEYFRFCSKSELMHQTGDSEEEISIVINTKNSQWPLSGAQLRNWLLDLEG